jgi:amino acid transporter
MHAVRRYAWLAFLLFALLLTLFGIFPGRWFEEGVDWETALLTATFAAVAVVLTVAVAATAFRRGERWAWWASWVWPLFFVVHGIAFFVMDFVFAALGWPSSRWPPRSRKPWIDAHLLRTIHIRLLP